jgi:hypothetical protein
MSIFVILIMIASMAGVAVLMSQPPEEEQPYEQPPQEFPEEQPPIETVNTYRSDPFDANVTEIFPSLTLTAQTEETEINLIDAEIYGVQGITRVESQYSTQYNQITAGGLTYVADITFQPGLDNQEILDAINAKTTKLTSVDAFSSALLQIPVTLELKNIEDENDIKEYTFTEPFTQGYINVDTQKGDMVEAVEQAVFSGENLIQSIAFENRNVTAEPIQLSLTQEVKIDSLTNHSRFGGEVAYAGQDFTVLEAELASFEGVEALKLQNMRSGSFIELTFDANQPLETLQDLNENLTGLEGVSTVNFSEQFFYIGFEETSDFTALTQNIQSVLTEKTVNAEIVAPSVFLSGDLNTVSNDVTGLSENILAVLARENTREPLFMQEASINITEPLLVDPETEESFATDQNQTVFNAWLKPGHTVGESVTLTLNATIVRGQVVEIQAIEE